MSEAQTNHQQANETHPQTATKTPIMVRGNITRVTTTAITTRRNLSKSFGSVWF